MEPLLTDPGETNPLWLRDFVGIKRVVSHTVGSLVRAYLDQNALTDLMIMKQQNVQDIKA